MSSRIPIVRCLVVLWTTSTFAQFPERTVIDNERACAFSVGPFDGNWGGIGLFMGNSFQYGVDWMANAPYLASTYLLMQPEAIKGPTQIYLQHLDPEWDAYIYSDLKAFEREEVQQGRAPFFITATYQGNKRPVLYLPLWEPRSARRAQAVNVGDDRFIKFFVKNGIRRKRSPYALQNWGIQEDNVYFKQDAYYVLDDAGGQHSVMWDSPFPRSNIEWEDAAKYALRRIKELAPDLILIQNQAGIPIANSSRYAEVFAPIDGVWQESFMHPDTAPARDILWSVYFQRLLPPDGADAYRIQFFSAFWCRSSEEIRSTFLAYLIFCGPNAFFAPRLNGGANPQYYASTRNALGSPVEPPQRDSDSAWSIWSRKCQGGIVYLNWTGAERWISLPDGGPFYDPTGRRVSGITLQNLTASYVTTEPGDRIAKPAINPRRPELVTGPLTITLETEPLTPAAECRIRYTLDGSEPDGHSTLYAGPFEIDRSCVVKARAMAGPNPPRFAPLPSLTNLATYRLTDEVPTVEFHHASDCGSEFLEHDYPVVSLSHVSGQPVTVSYRTCGGTALPGEDYVLEPGTVTFRPGEQHRYFYLHIMNDGASEPDESIVISVSNPVNATLGEGTTYTYTIEDNDREPAIEEASESFETGDFEKYQWRHSGDAYWAVCDTQSHSGRHSAKAGQIGHNETTALEVTITCKDGEIRFWRKVSSENGYDRLTFSVDGAQAGEWSGEQGWAELSFPVTTGQRVLKWSYTKDGSESSGADTAWIDDIEFPLLW